MHLLERSKQAGHCNNQQIIASDCNLASFKTSKVSVQAMYKADKNIRKFFEIVKDRNIAVFYRLPLPWRKSSLHLAYILKGYFIWIWAIHYGHAERDAMLREASDDVWWPRIHREIVEKAQKCLDWQKAGKNL